MSKRTIESGLHLHVDCVSGAAGDMTLGALIDLGVPESVIRDAVEAMDLEPERVTAKKVVKAGIAATDVSVADDPSHEDHHHHRSYAEIRDRLAAASLDENTRALAGDMFECLAVAEAKLHGTTVDEVHFHEVGAIDSIIDVVGSAAGFAWLAPASVSCPSVAMGHGSVQCAHGKLPVPSPAAVEILRDASGVVEGGGIAKELCTPTGAAILATVVTEWTPCPAMTPIAIGYGAGDRDLEDRPNVMRMTVGRRGSGVGDVIVVEANLDDMTPEQAAYVAERLFEHGAVDVWWTPIVMKKSRPAFQLGVLAPPHALDKITDALLVESTTLGVRYSRAKRRTLERESETVETPFGLIDMVVAKRGSKVLRASPEFESCRRAAVSHAVPIGEVYDAAQRAFGDLSR